jgi:uncharacterized protein YigE (DUF2233 family)
MLFNRKNIFIFLFFASACLFVFAQNKKNAGDHFVTYMVDIKKQELKLYWKNEANENFKSILNLKLWIEKKNKKLLFAANAGMYKTDNSPLGLFIEDKKIISPLNKANATGNFYITDDNVPFICTTSKFLNNGKIKYATQSGPMLVIDGRIHSAFTKGSANVNIRNGVGILPDNTIIFAMSKKEISFYDFANYFKNMGCKNALYLDGFVSRTYLPEQNWIQTDGNLGVIIGVTANK